MVCIEYNVKWRKGQVGRALGEFGGSVLVMGEWSVSQWIQGRQSIKKIRDYLGIFPNMGGVSSIPETFVN